MMHRTVMIGAALSTILGAALIVSGCAPGVDDYDDPFVKSGETIALSGAGAGPRGACFTCHGMAGEGDGATAPQLAGLDAGYLQKQLEDYASGLRPDPLMSPIAERMSQVERARVAHFYADMSPPEPAALSVTSGVDAPDAALMAQGRILFHMGAPKRGVIACASCHGANGEGAGAANPPLSGQSRDYIRRQLEQWRDAHRRNDPLDVMGQVSRPLSDEEVQAVSTYAASLGAASSPAIGSVLSRAESR